MDDGPQQVRNDDVCSSFYLTETSLVSLVHVHVHVWTPCVFSHWQLSSISQLSVGSAAFINLWVWLCWINSHFAAEVLWEGHWVYRREAWRPVEICKEKEMRYLRRVELLGKKERSDVIMLYQIRAYKPWGTLGHILAQVPPPSCQLWCSSDLMFILRSKWSAYIIWWWSGFTQVILRLRS